MPDSYILTEAETRHLVKYALKMLSPGLLRDMQSGVAVKRDPAVEIATDVVLGHLARANHKLVKMERATPAADEP